MRDRTMQPPAEAPRAPHAPEFGRDNNFDLIRLVAAMQVAIVHSIETFGIRLPHHDLTLQILECFPGVPIFFGVSGFLISASYFRSSTLSSFTRNRVLRIFPALWLCLLLSIVLVTASGYFAANPPPLPQFAIWLVSQLTFIQFYNPDFLRGFGVGAINGSLWTIPVELQFYVLTPLFGLLLVKRPKLFMVAVALFAIANLVNSSGVIPQHFGDGVRKLVAITFVPWFVLFLAGMLASYYWHRIGRLFTGTFLYWAAAYVVMSAIGFLLSFHVYGNAILLPWGLLLGAVVLSAGFTNPTLASRVLHRNDISYGLYIYHMPIFNFLLMVGGGLIGWATAGIGLAATIVVAILSWRFVERPALGLKRRTLLRRGAGPHSDLPKVDEDQPA